MKNFMPTNLITNENISIPYKTDYQKSHEENRSFNKSVSIKET